MPELAEPPVEKKPNFLQQFAASRPKNEAELQAIEKGVTPPPALEVKPPVAATPPPEVKAAAAPPVAAPAPKVEADPDEEILSGKRSPKSDDFRRVKTRATEAQKERDELEKKWQASEKALKEAGKVTDNSAALKALEKERDDLKSKHDAFIVQFTPEFQQKYDTQIASTLGSLKNLIPEAEAAKLADILQLPESPYRRKMIAEATESLDAYTVTEIAHIGREVQRMNQERKDSMTKASQTLSTIAEERQKQAKEADERQGKAFDEKFKEFSEGEKAIPVFQKRDGDKEWNAGVEERSRVARVIYRGEFDTDHDRAEAAAWAAAAPGILQSWKADVAAKDAEIAQAKATIERLQGANPGINGDRPGAQGGNKPTFLDRMRQNSVQ